MSDTDNLRDNPVKPIPEDFESYEAAASFWETHDTTDYLDDFEAVPFESALQKRHFEVKIDEDLIERLHRQADAQSISISQLVNQVLRNKLEDAAA
ncbi:MAG: CopG family antitoxin [Cyanobacteria bacterium P01_A01_bin.114]